MKTTKDHFHDDYILLKLPEFISFLLSHLMSVIPACPNWISKSKCGGVLGNVPSPFQKIILPWVSSRDQQWVNKTSKPAPFPSCRKPLFQNEANFKWFSFLLKITQERFCTSPYFESEGFWNSEMAFFKNTTKLFVFAPKFSILSIVFNFWSSKEKKRSTVYPKWHRSLSVLFTRLFCFVF